MPPWTRWMLGSLATIEDHAVASTNLGCPDVRKKGFLFYSPGQYYRAIWYKTIEWRLTGGTYLIPLPHLSLKPRFSPWMFYLSFSFFLIIHNTPMIHVCYQWNSATHTLTQKLCHRRPKPSLGIMFCCRHGKLKTNGSKLLKWQAWQMLSLVEVRSITTTLSCNEKRTGHFNKACIPSNLKKGVNFFISFIDHRNLNRIPVIFLGAISTLLPKLTRIPQFLYYSFSLSKLNLILAHEN